MMTRALAVGRSEPHAPTHGSCWTTRLPFTNRSPSIVSTPASPRLKATTSTIPRATRLRETAVRSSTSADGHGRSPPEIPSPSKDLQVTGAPSAPGGR